MHDIPTHKKVNESKKLTGLMSCYHFPDSFVYYLQLPCCSFLGQVVSVSSEADFEDAIYFENL